LSLPPRPAVANEIIAGVNRMSNIPSFKNLSAKKLSILVILAVAVGLCSVTFTVYSKMGEKTFDSEKKESVTAPILKQPRGCCGQSLESSETITLLGTYYSLKNGQSVVLMFNNKGADPLVANPIFLI